MHIRNEQTLADSKEIYDSLSKSEIESSNGESQSKWGEKWITEEKPCGSEEVSPTSTDSEKIKNSELAENEKIKNSALAENERIENSNKKSQDKCSGKWIAKEKLRAITLVNTLKFLGLSIVLYTFYNTFYYTAADIICDITPFSESYFSFCRSVPDFSAIVDVQVEVQEELSKKSVQLYSKSDGSLKKAEIATKDLIIVVKYSDLQRSEILSEFLTKFAEQCSEVDEKLTTFQVRAQGSLDRTMTYISFILRVIEHMKEREVTSSREKRELMRTHDLEMIYINNNLENLIVNAKDALDGLKKLDYILEQIAVESHLEQKFQTIGEKELLSEIWSALGGNTVERRKFSENLKLLRNLESQRKMATININGIMSRLKRFRAQLNNLRDVTARTLLTRESLELQIVNINKALMRLKEASQDASKQSYKEDIVGIDESYG